MTEIPLKPITVTVSAALSIIGIGRTKFYELVKEANLLSALDG